MKKILLLLSLLIFSLSYSQEWKFPFEKIRRLQSVENDEFSLKTTYVIPDSVGEGFLNAFCNREN